MMFQADARRLRGAAGLPRNEPAATAVPVESQTSYLEANPLAVERIGFIVFAVVAGALGGIPDSTTPEDIWWALASVIALLGVIKERRLAVRLLLPAFPLFIILALAVASTTWSIDPDSTLRRSLALVGSGVISLWVVCRLGYQRFLDVLGTAILILAAISFVLIVAVPGVGWEPTGEFRGVFFTKNVLGEYMILGLLTVICKTNWTQAAGRPLKIGIVLFFLLLLAGSRNGTSILIAAVFAGAWPLLMWCRKNLRGKPKLLLALSLAAAVFIGLVSTFGKSVVLGSLGKDETLSSRTDVWEYVGDAINERPLLGYGYKVFWLSHGSQDVEKTRWTVTWATQAHNGILEVALDLGKVGVAAVLLFGLIATARAVKFFWRGRDLYSAWPLFYFVSFVFTNLTESPVARYYDIPWLVYGAAFFFVTEAGQRYKAAAKLRGT